MGDLALHACLEEHIRGGKREALLRAIDRHAALTLEGAKRIRDYLDKLRLSGVWAAVGIIVVYADSRDVEIQRALVASKEHYLLRKARRMGQPDLVHDVSVAKR
jgi:hypothetical protein